MTSPLHASCHPRHLTLFPVRVSDSSRCGKLRRLRASAASVLTTPHSGYHYDDTARRFFEGWYFKVLPTLVHAECSSVQNVTAFWISLIL